MGIIYKATNTVDGKVYVGQTILSLKQRKGQHAYRAKKGDRRSSFQLAILEHGFNSFLWEQIDSADTAEELDAKEKRWIAHYDSMNPEKGYNGTDGGARFSLSPDTRRKMSEAAKGKRAGEKNPMFGKHLTPWNKGAKGVQKHTEETRRKISEANKNPPEEIRCKIREARKKQKALVEAHCKTGITRKGRRKGENHPSVVITEETARLIKIDLQAGLRMSIIARKFHIKPYIVEHIKYGRSWAWLEISH